MARHCCSAITFVSAPGLTLGTVTLATADSLFCAPTPSFNPSSTSIVASFGRMGGEISITAGGDYWITADSSPYVLSRMGVTKEQFVVGSEVRLAGPVSTLVPNRFLLTNMLRPDGTEVVLTTEGDRFWNGRQV
ncbi:MAG TPA: hypothetical protein VJR89_37355, partial [Polyangiales bacterium]|nr:hypothetical protein [Polyangiales bacterium]